MRNLRAIQEDLEAWVVSALLLQLEARLELPLLVGDSDQRRQVLGASVVLAVRLGVASPSGRLPRLLGLLGVVLAALVALELPPLVELLVDSGLLLRWVVGLALALVSSQLQLSRQHSVLRLS